MMTESIPKKAFDSEYMTEWRREMQWLQERGINPTYTRITPTYGIRQYKYKKTAALFSALAEFYGGVEGERAWRRLSAVEGKPVRGELPALHHVTAADLDRLLAEDDTI